MNFLPVSGYWVTFYVYMSLNLRKFYVFLRGSAAFQKVYKFLKYRFYDYRILSKFIIFPIVFRSLILIKVSFKYWNCVWKWVGVIIFLENSIKIGIFAAFISLDHTILRYHVWYRWKATHFFYQNFPVKTRSKNNHWPKQPSFTYSQLCTDWLIRR